ncbi:MAG TPA: hypothetical protein H9842_02615 [Candidatus Agathobaculum merdipullorum]|nr:hypothetical protein [uncultured Agathobaculum sp.]HIY12468.1 hypothetical protein [Candidatus Agathobaculum merdipullorum]
MSRKYFSEPQLMLLDTVKILGCLRLRQAYALMKRNYGLSDSATKTAMRQLISSGECILNKNANCILFSPDDFCEPMLYAVDLALAIAEFQSRIQFIPPHSPYLLNAYYDRQNVQLGVIYVPSGTEKQKCDDLESIHLDVMIPPIFVLLLENSSQISLIHSSCACLLAWENEAGQLVIQKNRTWKENDLNAGQKTNG